jgi:hypothetical protein
MRAVAQDAVLVLALAGLFAVAPGGPLAVALAAAIPIVLGWGVLTLHFPTRVEVDDEGIAFFGYGRVHRFRWRAIERIKVRHFVVRDRVLVRIAPASPFHGRYWLLDSIKDYDALVRLLEDRSTAAATR